MGVTRTRPSLIVAETTFTNTDLPNAAGQSLSWSFQNMPVRGIIKRVSLRMIYNAAFTSVTEYDPIYVHSVGPTGKNAGTADGAASVMAHYSLDLASTIVTGAQEAFAAGNYVYMPSLALASPSGLPTTSTMPGLSEFYYDISGSVKGPNHSVGELFFTWISDNTNYQTNVVSVTCRVEIEPCF